MTEAQFKEPLVILKTEEEMKRNFPIALQQLKVDMNRLIEEVASAKPPAARPPPPPKSLVDMPPALPSLKYVETPDDAYRYSQDAPYHKHVP